VRAWPKGSIRIRTVAAAILVVGISLLIASVAVVLLLERSLRLGVRTTAQIRAEAIAREIQRGTLPQNVVLGVEAGDEEFVQILDANFEVVASSPNVADLREAVERLRPGQSREIPPRSPPDVEPFDDPFALVAREPTRGSSYTVIVGRSLEPVGEARDDLERILARTMPVLLAIVGIVTWVVVSKALSPVEAIRAEVESISGRELHRRVPDPPGNDEIARLAATMNRMLGRLESARRRERRFVSDASHELRSPVAVIRQHAEVALSHPDRTDLREFAEVVLEEDIRLQRLVEDLLLLTRIDEGTLSLPDEPIDLDDLVLEEARRLRSTTALRIDASRVSSGRVRGDRDQLRRLVRNLTENAARHARDQIRLRLQEFDGRVVFHVEDDGAGVPAGDRDRIFGRFVRLEEARDRDSGGSGLGLAIVREVANFHGGTVSVLDSELGGARFEVQLPTQGG
jgi:signal transduction histidine kinase